ncbi:MAG: helix-turn-helix domain-containing protein, partial [Ignavibacteria bacterium]|nr:helix-turn-helix domain-containing protein [Ignavibacteria bacterium]
NFREDLYHRLNVLPILVPPLRERAEDIQILVEHFARDISNKHKKPVTKFSEDAIRVLQHQSWTGNVRELRNLVERIIILVDKKEIAGKDIDFLFAGNQQSVDELVDTSNSFQEFKEKAERVFILKQLRANDWNISKTAEILEIQRSHLYNKMKKYSIEKDG